MASLRVVIFDETDTRARRAGGAQRHADGTLRGAGGLSWVWRLGSVMHRRARPGVVTSPASSWREALRWAVSESQRRGAPISELQVWGHGGWGFMLLDRERLDVETVRPEGALGASIDALRDALAPDALVWLRCCSAFGTAAGHELASRLSERLRARVAGHTHIIGAWQSGTHSVAPGEPPAWSVEEGVERVDGASRAVLSSPTQPRTISCLHLGLPDGW